MDSAKCLIRLIILVTARRWEELLFPNIDLMLRLVKFIPTEIDMKEKKETVSGMEEVNTFTMMAATILETGLKARWKDKDSLSMPMVILSTKDSGRTITMREKGG